MFWKRLIIFYFLISKTYSTHVIDCECGVKNQPQDRIVGGNIASNITDYPWMVYILEDTIFTCGGALINDRYVLTAGHCVAWSNANKMSVVLGRYDIRSETGIEIKVKYAKLHENFISDEIHDTNDIALLKLKNSVSFDMFIHPICLPNPLSEYANLNATIAGWGRVNLNFSKGSYLLKEASVKILPDIECLESIIGPHFADSMMCAYWPATDACMGDSGGPLMYSQNFKTEIIGIVSWGIRCAEPNIPGIYTKVVNFLKWIEQHTLDGVYCKNT